MKVFYCQICDKTIINKPRNKHNKTKSHDFMKNYLIIIIIMILFGMMLKILFMIILSFIRTNLMNIKLVCYVK